VTWNSLNWLKGTLAIDPIRKLALQDGFVTRNDHDRLCKYMYYVSFTLNHSQLKPHRTFQEAPNQEIVQIETS
jgi:hypothetical protein